MHLLLALLLITCFSSLAIILFTFIVNFLQLLFWLLIGFLCRFFPLFLYLHLCVSSSLNLVSFFTFLHVVSLLFFTTFHLYSSTLFIFFQFFFFTVINFCPFFLFADPYFSSSLLLFKVIFTFLRVLPLPFNPHFSTLFSSLFYY